MESSNRTDGKDNFENPEGSRTALVIGLANLLVGVIAIVGNSLLCFTVYRDPYRRLRNTASYLVVNLAFADLLTGLITEPFYAAFEISRFMEKESAILYVIGESTAYLFVNASILSILSLAYDRYVAVSYPLLHDQKMNRKRIFTLIVLLWIYSVLFSMLRFIGVPQDVFYWIDLHVNYTLFGAILIGLYIAIYLTIKRQLAQSLRTQGYNSQTRRQPTYDDIETKLRSEKKMTKTVFRLLLVAVSCMLPLYIMLHVELLCEPCMEVPVVKTISKLSEPILFLNSGLNPFLYAWTIPKYRQALKEILRRTWCLQAKHKSKERENSPRRQRCKSTSSLHNLELIDRKTPLSNMKEFSTPAVVLTKIARNNSI